MYFYLLSLQSIYIRCVQFVHCRWIVVIVFEIEHNKMVMNRACCFFLYRLVRMIFLRWGDTHYLLNLLIYTWVEIVTCNFKIRRRVV